jgi:hypothetical protein
MLMQAEFSGEESRNRKRVAAGFRMAAHQERVWRRLAFFAKIRLVTLNSLENKVNDSNCLP